MCYLQGELISVQLVVGGVMSVQAGAVTAGMSFHFSSASAETVVIVVIEIGAIKGVYAPTHVTVEIDVIDAEPPIFGSVAQAIAELDVIAADPVVTIPPIVQTTALLEVIAAAPSRTTTEEHAIELLEVAAAVEVKT